MRGYSGSSRLPHRDRRAEVAVARDRPVDGVADPLAELAVLDVVRHPVDVLVQLAHAVAELGDPDEPRRHGLVDEGLPAAPAVRVAVLVGRLAEQAPGVAHGLGERLVRVGPEHAGDLAELRGEHAALVERQHDGDAGCGADLLVVGAVGRGLVHDAGALAGLDVVGDEDLPGVLHALGVREEVEQALVLHAVELRARQGADDRGSGVLGALVAEVLRVGGHGVRSQQVVDGTGVGTVSRASRPRRQHHVRDRRPDGQRGVRRQRPGGRRPGERAHTGQVERGSAVAVQREGDRDGLVLAHLVDVVVHAQLVVRQRRLVVPAVRQDPEALVRQALVPELLPRPEHALHERGVERLVVVLEVDPARLAGDVLLPLVGVLQDGLLGGGVEHVDAHGVDLVLLGDAELAHRLELGGQAVGVPAEAAVHLLAAHGLVAREDVLRVPGQQVAVVRQAVRERGAVVEGPLVAALALVDGRLERVVALPEGEDPPLDGGEGRRGDDASGAVVLVGTVQGVAHRGAPVGCRFSDHEDGAGSAVPPRLPRRAVRRVTTARVRVRRGPVRPVLLTSRSRGPRSSGSSPVMAGSTLV